MTVIRACAVQMVSTFDVEANLKMAQSLLQQAADGGAQWAVLPENFAVLDSDNLYRWGEEERENGIFSRFLSDISKKLGLWIVGGTIPCRLTGNGDAVDAKRVRAASLVFDPQGDIVARYDKLHLFDVVVQDSQGEYRESRVIAPGEQPIVANLQGINVGLSVCYDLRFPELYSDLSNMGSQVFTVPSAFTFKTGQAHWELLLRARAIENQAFVIAPNQGGEHTSKRITWGHSMIVDPWGSVLSCIESGPGIALADLDFSWLNEVRAAMPVLHHKRYGVALKS